MPNNDDLTRFPLGSNAFPVFDKNVRNLDVAVNDKENESWIDRLGRTRKTWHGFEEAFQQFLIDSGYVNIGDYIAGLEITERNQIFWKEGELYRAGASLELPYTTTGDWATEGLLFVAVGDQALRQALASQHGASIVGTENGTVEESFDAINNDIQEIKILTKPLTGSGAIGYSASEGNSLVLSGSRFSPQMVGGKITSGHYDHFGIMDVLPTGNPYLMFRRGSSHEDDPGKIVISVMDDSGVWGTPLDISQKESLDHRDPSGGVLSNGRLVSATITRDPQTKEWLDIDIYTSDDYGSSWVLRQTIERGSTVYRFPFGKGIQVGSKFYISYYSRTGTTYTLGLLESSDGGETWNVGPNIYQGEVDYNETALVNIGGGSVLAISRIGSGAGGYLRQFISSNGGLTWSDQGVLESFDGDGNDYLASPSGSLITYGGKDFILILYTSRSSQRLWYRLNSVSNVLSGNVGWRERNPVYTAPNMSGYQSQVVLPSGKIIGNLFREETPDVLSEAYSFELHIGDIPAYDSGFFAVDSSSQYSINHGLSHFPSRVVLTFSPINTPFPGTEYMVYPTYFNDGQNRGSGAQIIFTRDEVRIGTGSFVWGTSYFRNDSTRYTSGYYRVRVYS